METKKRVLIVTDGTDQIKVIAELIASCLTDSDVKICQAESFAGTDLLPAHIFFLGCENPNPESFQYLSQMLAHINLANRRCGVFSNNTKALKYLSGLVMDCEASLGEPLLAGDTAIKPADVKKWLKGIL